MLYGNQPPPLAEPPPVEQAQAPPSRAINPNWYPPLPREPTPEVSQPPAQGDQPTPTHEPPPLPTKEPPPAVQQPDFDEQQEELARKAQEDQMYNGTVLDTTGKPLRPPKPVTVDDYANKRDDIKELQTLIPTLPPKSQPYYIKQMQVMRRELNNQVDQENKKALKDYHAKLSADLQPTKVPYQSPKVRADQAAVLKGPGDELLAQSQQEQAATDPKESFDARYNFTVSPLNTMAGPKKVGPDGNPTADYGQLYQAATNIALTNQHIQPDQVMRYVMMAGSPVVTLDKDKHVVPTINGTGINGRKGAAGTNYEVIGRDPRDYHLLRFADGTTLSVDPISKAALERARVEGYKAGKKFFVDEAAKKAEAEKPGLVERAYRTIWPAIPKSE
jgi:hypothetical protein